MSGHENLTGGAENSTSLLKTPIYGQNYVPKFQRTDVEA